MGAALVPPLQQDAASCGSRAPALFYRPLQPVDFLEVKAAHAVLFPIDYEDAFFHRATGGLDRIWSCAAFSTDACGRQQLVGFITAKSVFLHEVDFSDRHHMGLMSAVLDHDRVLYFLTLGVLEGHRHRGIASSLVATARQHACETRCRAVFLHVIAYNNAALGLYSRQGFAVVARLPAFYNIATGRQPDPQQQAYDAFLCVRYVGAAAGVGGAGSPWGALSAAWTPLRFALGRMQACVPTFRPLPKSLQQPNGSSSSHSSQQSSTACPQQQQQQQMPLWQPLQPPHHYMQQPANGWEQRLPPEHRQQQQQPNGPHDWGDPHAAAAAAERHKQQWDADRQHHNWRQPPHHHYQHQHQQQRQSSQTPHRMLHWMFNASSRTQQQQPQQRQHQAPPEPPPMPSLAYSSQQGLQQRQPGPLHER